MNLTRRQIVGMGNGIRSMLESKFPKLAARNMDTETLFELDFSKPETHEKIVRYAKYRLRHLPIGLIDSAMMFAEIRGMLRAAKILSQDEIFTGEYAKG